MGEQLLEKTCRTVASERTTRLPVLWFGAFARRTDGVVEPLWSSLDAGRAQNPLVTDLQKSLKEIETGQQLSWSGVLEAGEGRRRW